MLRDRLAKADKVGALVSAAAANASCWWIDTTVDGTAGTVIQVLTGRKRAAKIRRTLARGQNRSTVRAWSMPESAALVSVRRRSS